LLPLLPGLPGPPCIVTFTYRTPKGTDTLVVDPPLTEIDPAGDKAFLFLKIPNMAYKRLV